jgi:ABC-type nitrate/sulfonate/bicarbonate transport system substrate-binding protein
MAMGRKTEVIITRCPVGNASEIVIQKGWLKEAYEKLGVELRLLNTLERSHWVKHFTQESPLSFREGGNIPPIWGQSNDFETKVIGLRALPQSHSVIVRPDSDLRILKDIKGRKIAIPRHKNAKVDFWWATVKRMWENILASVNLSRNDVTFVEIDVENDFLHKETETTQHYIFNNSDDGAIFQKEEIDALEKNAVDAIYSYGGRVYALESLGIGRNIFDITRHPELDQTTNLHPNIVTVNARFAEENPELVKVYLAQLLRAGEWAKTHKQEVLGIFAEGTFVTPELLAKSRPVDFNQHLSPGFEEADIKSLESQKEFLLQNRFIDRDFDVRSWLEPRFLNEALTEEDMRTPGT